MELNTITLSDFTALATVYFEKEKASVPREAATSGMFRVDTIPANTGEVRRYTEIDAEEYSSKKPQGEQATRGRVQQGYTKDMSVTRFAKDIGITYEMRQFNKYPEVTARLTNLARQPLNRMELDLQHRIGFGTATTYTDLDGELVDISVGDTLALFSTAHTLRGSSTTYRNILANNPQLSKGSLELMEAMKIANTYNMFGEKVVMPFDILWTTDDPNTTNTAREYLQSTAAIEAPNAGVLNVYKGKYRHVVLSRVATTAVGANDSTKAKYWGIASSMGTDAHMGVWEEPRLKVPTDLNAGEEFSTDDWNYGSRAGWGICILTGAWIGFSAGNGTA